MTPGIVVPSLIVAVLTGCASARGAQPVAAAVSASPCLGVEARQELPAPRGAVADSFVVQARVRFAVADFMVALNSRSAADLAVRFDWDTPQGELTPFLDQARGTGASVIAELPSSPTWWSDAPGRSVQRVCVPLTVRRTDFSGVPVSSRFAIQASMIDDGRAAYLGRLRVIRLSRP